MTVQIGPEHIAAVETIARILEWVPDMVRDSIGDAASDELSMQRPRLAHVAAYLKGQMHDD